MGTGFVQIDVLHASSHGRGIKGKKRISRIIPSDRADLRIGRQPPMHGAYALCYARYNFDAVLAVAHGDDGKNPRTGLVAQQLDAFLARRTMADGDMPAEVTVDIVHHLHKNSAVRRRVAELMVTDIVMNHLVDKRILQLLLGIIETLTDTQAKIRTLFASEPSYPLAASEHTHVCTGIRQTHRQDGQCAAKHRTIVQVEMLEYVILCRFHWIWGMGYGLWVTGDGGWGMGEFQI